MIYGQTGYSLGFGLELVDDRCGELLVKPLSIEGRWLTKTSLHDYPPITHQRNELGSANALVSTNGNSSRLVGNSLPWDYFRVARHFRCQRPAPIQLPTPGIRSSWRKQAAPPDARGCPLPLDQRLEAAQADSRRTPSGCAGWRGRTVLAGCARPRWLRRPTQTDE